MINNRNWPAFSRGFSLLELMLVLAAMVFLSMTAMVMMNRLGDESQTSQVTTDLGIFIAGLQNYRAKAPANAPAPSAETLASMQLFPRATVENGKLKSSVQTLSEVVETPSGWGVVFSGFSRHSCPDIINKALSSYRADLTSIHVGKVKVGFDSVESWAQSCAQNDSPTIAFGLKAGAGIETSLAPAVKKSSGFVNPNNKRWGTDEGMQKKGPTGPFSLETGAGLTRWFRCGQGGVQVSSAPSGRQVLIKLFWKALILKCGCEPRKASTQKHIQPFFSLLDGLLKLVYLPVMVFTDRARQFCLHVGVAVARIGSDEITDGLSPPCFFLPLCFGLGHGA